MPILENRQILRTFGLSWILLALVLSALVAAAQSTRVENARCGFSIVFPKKPYRSSNKVSRTGKHFIRMTRYYLETPDSLLAVSCSALGRGRYSEQAMDEARDASLRATGTRLVKEERFGRVRLLEVEGQGVRGLVKLAAAKNHYTQVLALSHSGSLSPEMRAFVDSFLLLH